MIPTIPARYAFLNSVGTLPKLIAAALQYLGVHEIKGKPNNPVIMDMAKGLGIDDIYASDDEQSWCAVFINHLIRITGKPIDLHPKDRYDLMRALKTAGNFNNIPIDQWKMGDIMIMTRPGGGHVFLPIAKTHVGTIAGIGGNQSNAVTFSEFDKKRIVSVKRYYQTAAPESAKQYIIDSSGVKSINEF